MQQEVQLKANLKALFAAYGAATGLRDSTVAKAVAGDARFHAERVEGPATFTVRSYDLIVGRFTSIWPADTPWPAAVPRAEPRALPRPVTGRIAARARNPEADDNGKETQS